MFKKNRYILPIIIIILIILITIAINNNWTIVFYGDSYKQQIQFYAGMWEKFHNGSIGFWDWTMLFGTNSFAQTFYCQITNPFLYIILLFPKVLIPQIYTFTNLLKIFLTYLTAYWWLKKINRSEPSSIIGALILCFSGWFLTMYEWGHLLDIFPLYFIAFIFVENYLHSKKMYPIILTIALMTIINFYSSYMFLPFLLVYGVYRYYILYDYSSIKAYLKIILKFIFIILVGVGIAGLTLLPTAYIVIQTPRVNESYQYSIINFSMFYRFFSSIFLPMAYRIYSNVLSTVFASGSYGGVSLYCLFITPICILLVPFTKDKKEKKSIIALYLLFFTVMFFPILYKLLQGTTETRWFYMFSIISAIAVSYVNDQIINKQIEKKTFIYCFFVISVIMVLLIIYASSKAIIVDKILLPKYIIAMVIFTLLYLYSFYYNKVLFTVLLVTIEGCFCFILYLNLNKQVANTQINTTEFQTVLDYLKNNDDTFYRIQFSQKIIKNNANFDDYNYVLANLPYAYDLMGTSGYTSLYNFDQSDYINRYQKDWTFYQSEGHVYNTSLENVKYWIGYNNETVPFGFSFIANIDEFSIYQNNYFIELGYYTDKLLDDDVVLNRPYLTQDQLLAQYAVVDKGQNIYQLDSNLIPIGQWVNPEYFEYNLTNSNAGTLIIVENFKMPYLSIKYLMNDDIVLQKYFYECNYVGLYCPNDIQFNKIIVEFDYRFIDDLKMNVYMMQDFDLFDTIYQQHSQNKLENIVFKNDSVTADISIDDTFENGILVTSIAYDEGWKAYVDGVETDIEKVNLGFIGLRLSTGVHHIEFRYLSPYFTEGMILSGVSLLALFLSERKRIKKVFQHSLHHQDK